MKLELIPLLFVVAIYMVYAVQVRNGRIDGRAILAVGAAMWLVGVGITSALLWRSIPVEGFRVVGVNALTMTVLTAWCIHMAWRSAQIKEIYTGRVGDTTVVVRACSPWRIRGVDALVLPNTTALRAITGPAASVTIAAGKGMEKDTRAAAPVKLDRVVATSGGALAVPRVFHVAVHEPSKPVDAVRLRQGIVAAAAQAKKAGLRTVAFPIAALRGLSPQDTAQAIVGGALQQKKGLEKIVFVALDSRDAPLIQAAIESKTGESQT